MSEASKPHKNKRKTSKWKIAFRILMPFLLIGAVAGGMVFGYVVLGKQDLAEAFQWSTWKHVFDLVFAP